MEINISALINKAIDEATYENRFLLVGLPKNILEDKLKKSVESEQYELADFIQKLIDECK